MSIEAEVFEQAKKRARRKGFLFALGAGGQAGVEQILKRMREEIRRDMILLGCKSIKELNKTKIAYR